MDEKIKSLLLAFAKLSTEEKKKFKEEIEKYERRTLNEQRTYSESLEKSLGPLSSISCPRCGR